jgi:23S rRNA (guanosine2251-2'-O)-methyltransferase
MNTKKNTNTYCLLHNIRSIHNVGSIFRTADANGISKIYLTGYTPTPLDRFGNERNDFKKVSLGAEKTVKWEYIEDINKAISDLKENNTFIVGVEQTDLSVNYTDIQQHETTAFIFGNETEGIDKEVLSKCDTIVEIPMRGEKESLNVSVTVGIILFNYRDRN